MQDPEAHPSPEPFDRKKGVECFYQRAGERAQVVGLSAAGLALQHCPPEALGGFVTAPTGDTLVEANALVDAAVRGEALLVEIFSKGAG